MNDVWHALAFGAGWGLAWGALLALLLATSPPRLSEGRTKAQEEAEDDNPHPAHPPTIDGTAVHL